MREEFIRVFGALIFEALFKKQGFFSAPKRRDIMKSTKISTHYITKIGILSAIAVVLMLFDVALPFAPSFYKIDLSEVVVLLGSFSMGPVAGIIIEALKILLNLLINGTDTAAIGELANFLIGVSLILPASLIYHRRKSFKTAIVGMAVGTICMTIFGSAMNYFVLIPVYSYFYGMPLEALINMGTALNSNITDLKTLVLFAAVPFNLLKGVISSAIVLLTYKKLSPILHN